MNQEVDTIRRSEACVATPFCIIQPRNSNDVALAIKIIKLFQVKFALRSGDHSPNPGWSSIDDRGILLDMSKLNAIKVSRTGASPIVSVGPGARWGEVYQALDG
jgi:FAD/FMN-containing dehydrogenase